MMLSANNAWRERNPRPTMNFIQKNWKGILVCLVMAVPCWLLGQRFPIVGGPVFGILAGNFPMALCWQIFFAGPLVRLIFRTVSRAK